MGVLSKTELIDCPAPLARWRCSFGTRRRRPDKPRDFLASLPSGRYEPINSSDHRIIEMVWEQRGWCRCIAKRTPRGLAFCEGFSQRDKTFAARLGIDADFPCHLSGAFS